MKTWWKYIKPYLPYFIIGPICMLVEVAGEAFMPKLFSLIINKSADGTLSSSYSIGIMFIMILMALLMMAGGIGGAYFATKASVNFAVDLRSDAYAKIQKYSFANIDKFSSGSLVTRLTNDITQLQNFIGMVLRMALRAPGMLIAGLIMAITISPSLSVVFAVTIPSMLIVVLGIIFIGFGRFTVMQKKIDSLNTTVQENITNARVVKSFVREDYEEKKFKDANKSLKDSGIAAMRVMIFMQPVLTLFMNVTTLAVVWKGGNIVLDGGMQVGDLSAFITYVNQILMALMGVTILLMMSSRAIASGKRIKEVLEEKPDISDVDAKEKDLTVKRGEVEFRNVSFRYYKNSPDKVLDNISFRIESGKTLGIIGSTGSGKTTLVSMIPRLYDTDEGEVLVDGVNVRDYSLENLRDGIGMVLQKNTLFSGSIADNLRWGDQNATDEEVVLAASHAQADGFVSSFADGYNTVIDKGGANVSGGQRQRLCIARALLKKPKIIILDDSTSAVDTATEAKIRQALSQDLRNCTKIIIAQRISSVIDADEIIVMDDGKISGIGKHAELIENNEAYREIYTSQTEKGGN